MIDFEAMPHVADIPRHQASIRPNDVALWVSGVETTFAELNKRSNQVANGLLAFGVKSNERVGYLGKNTSFFYEQMFGAAKIRAAMNGINNRLAPPELQFILTDAAIRVLFVGPEFIELVDAIKAECPLLEHVIALNPGHPSLPGYEAWRDSQDATDPGMETLDDDDVMQLYTSGTTGRPKGVMLTNFNYNAVFKVAGHQEWASYNAGETMMNAMPQFHVAGCNVGILSIMQGARTIILPEINPMEILDLIEREKVVHAFWVPAVILMMSQLPDFRQRDYSSLKQVFYGASPITQSLLELAVDVMGARFTQVYGLTETNGTGTFLPPEAHDPAKGKLLSCGKGYEGTEVLCVDPDGKPVPTGEVGEIVIKADFVMKGYWNRPDATAEAIRNGYFHTGDAGYMDDEGYLYIHDRMKDMIVSGGENVYPAEVESAIFSHPEVADVAVIGVPDERWGEAVKALIVPHPGKAPTPESIIGWARERIAAYKCPKTVETIEAMPRNPSGKILRKDLREPYWQGVDRRVS